jgi:uncharacterized protein DUF4038/collagenase-like protein with putative collagen-binding domain
MTETRYRTLLSLPIACLSVLVLTSTLGAAPAYPVKVGPTGRYLVDQTGAPFMIVGDSPQAMIGKVSEADAELYFANRQARGFNTVWINLLCASYTGCNPDGTTFDGILPFNVPGDLTTPNEAYFARVDAILRLAARYGLLVILDPAETGDWLAVLYANGEDNCRAYGQYLGQRYAGFDNILWMHGNDYQDWGPDADQFTTAVARGIRDFDSRHLQTVQLNFFVSSSTDDPLWIPLIDLNAAYSYFPSYEEVLKDYNRGDFPVFLVETGYEFEFGGLPRIVRAQAYWAMLSGSAGQLYGSRYTWQFLEEWRDTLNSGGAMAMGHLAALFQSRPWYDLVPDQDHSVVTSGLGDFGSYEYVTAARTPDGRLVIVYVPTTRTITVDMSRMSGPAIARWFDPVAGVFIDISGSALPNSGLVEFTTPGDNEAGPGSDDWVLVLEASSGPVSPSSFIELTMTSVAYARGDYLGIFLKAFNSPRQSTRELYAGVVLPDGQTLVYFTGANAPGGVTSVASLRDLRPIALVAPGETLVFGDPNPLLTGQIPDDAPPGLYTWFALLVAPGALSNNLFDSGDVDIIAVRSINLLP